ncbi:SDR family NAD(P)-dependent oxidoreductase [Actinomadura geliboluensis]|uniref:SDR family NAD(P)-dependent oxidoreductase n=1 Tax=Actinomadura geliboluensis TaxID=882440 RepID=A0A5S4HAR1_9ACTN|nr:SDR family NAD(P)-dependent oxidoreductase [Actinomadura geliboluensis]TMR41824.1 SDR family NAD(P)-dependent oxidoreductase [Actinomadura geliboluensis]
MVTSTGRVTLTGRSALVTGASSGIGAVVAEALAAAGARVGLVARRKDRLEQVLARCREHSPDSAMWTADLADLDGIADLAAAAERELGGVDVLVNNAGMPKRRRVQDLAPAEAEDVMRLNYASPVRLTLALLPGMIARGRGHLVAIGSVAARLGPPHEGAYGASKAALTAFWESMAVDLDGTGVQVHVVQPALIAGTELFTLPGNEPPLSDVSDALPPERVADAVLAALETGKFEQYVPDWFDEMASGKAADVDAFVAGVKEWTRDRLEPPPP